MPGEANQGVIGYITDAYLKFLQQQEDWPAFVGFYLTKSLAVSDSLLARAQRTGLLAEGRAGWWAGLRFDWDSIAEISSDLNGLYPLTHFAANFVTLGRSFALTTGYGTFDVLPRLGVTNIEVQVAVESLETPSDPVYIDFNLRGRPMSSVELGYEVQWWNLRARVAGVYGKTISQEKAIDQLRFYRLAGRLIWPGQLRHNTFSIFALASDESLPPKKLDSLKTLPTDAAAAVKETIVPLVQLGVGVMWNF